MYAIHNRTALNIRYILCYIKLYLVYSKAPDTYTFSTLQHPLTQFIWCDSDVKTDKFPHIHISKIVHLRWRAVLEEAVNQFDVQT